MPRKKPPLSCIKRRKLRFLKEYKKENNLNGVFKLLPEYFPDGKYLTRDDYIIICGDFGGIWFGDKRDEEAISFYESKSYTVLFVDGNHENFDVLNHYPVTEWHGGKVHMIRSHVIHFMRGQILEIDGKSFFTFGGGISIDKHRRIPYVSWWPEEESSSKELDESFDKLKSVNYKVDYIITHAAPESIMRNELCKIHPMQKFDCLTEKFLYEIYMKTEFEMWFCGHYHFDAWVRSCKLQVLYNNIIKLAPGYPIAVKLS